ncbi:MAG: hypothetical protein GWN58_51085, partial [Anaerolineae bacterium]|nr:hypothetical protein [Anaerolineae bacterium]
QKRHFLERWRLQDEYQSRYRSYWEQRKALEDELQEIRRFNAQFQLDQDTEALGRAKEMAEHTRAIHAAQTAVNQALDTALG